MNPPPDHMPQGTFCGFQPMVSATLKAHAAHWSSSSGVNWFQPSQARRESTASTVASIPPAAVGFGARRGGESMSGLARFAAQMLRCAAMQAVSQVVCHQVIRLYQDSLAPRPRPCVCVCVWWCVGCMSAPEIRNWSPRSRWQL